MKRIFESLKQENIQVGYLYFYIHFITELICFFALKRIIGDSIILWISPLLYDVLAFAPQSLIGYINDKYPKFKTEYVGTTLLIIGIINMIISIIPCIYTSIAIIAIGNAFIHVAGAEATLKCSNGKMSHAAIFVSGGSFGVITGKILGASNMPMWMLIPLALTMIPFSMLASTYIEQTKNNNCQKFNYANNKVSPFTILLLATFVVIIRGYTGYGIPTSWDKTIFQTVLLFSFMGIGKALGGILIDSFGMRKTALISVAIAVPFLIIGDQLMIVSLIGVMLFSMTMAVTLGLVVSVLKKNPGLAFGYTTIGLILGSLPVFFIKITSYYINSIIILLSSILCLFILSKIIRKES